MAFNGVPVIQSITDRLVRVTGLNLLAGANGSIGLFGDATADVQLPDEFQPEEFAGKTLSDAVWARFVAEAPIAQPLMIRVDKAAGPPFQVRFWNDDGMNPTPVLEIYIGWQ